VIPTKIKESFAMKKVISENKGEKNGKLISI